MYDEKCGGTSVISFTLNGYGAGCELLLDWKC